MPDHNSPYRLLSSRVVYDNGWLRLDEDTVIHPGGDKGRFGVITMKEGATVLPVTPAKQVYLAREYKYGLHRLSIEVMSGGLEEGESALVAAKREMREELGLTADLWTYLGYVDPFTTVIRARNHMFLAQVLKETPTLDDPKEAVQRVAIPLAKAIDMVMEGEITHSASCVVLLKAARILK
jgi:ADP-ribose pyrophosphatase